MSHPSEPRLMVLHALRLKGLTSLEGVAAVAGLPGAEAARWLSAFVADGLTQEGTGRLSGFLLTPDGREEIGRLLAEELDAAGARDRVRLAYRRFVELNDELLALCTDWQLRPSVSGAPPMPNDHRDPSYDQAVLARLGDFDDAAQPICADLGGCLARFGRYGPGLRSARVRAEAGAGGYVASPQVASYHSLWFELHEDLLATLDIPRHASVP